jgi:hypothetical protein
MIGYGSSAMSGIDLLRNGIGRSAAVYHRTEGATPVTALFRD